MKARLVCRMVGIACLALLGSGTAGHADVLTAPGVYPAPGGTTFSGSGSAASGIRTVTYSGFDTSAYNKLWWGVVVDASMNGSNNTLNSVSISADGLTATWTGQTSVFGVNYSGLVDVEFIATLSPSSNATWVTASSVGISGPLAVLEIENGNSFSMTQQFLAKTGANPYQSFLSLNTAIHPYQSGLARTGTNGQFFYTDPRAPAAPAVPEPSTWAMMILGFAGVSFLAYRRRTQVLRVV